MTRHQWGSLAIVMAMSLLAPPIPAQASSQRPLVTPASAKGAEARVRVADGSRTVTLKGELLAVDSSHVWLLVNSRPTTIPRANVQGVRARVHRYDGKRGLVMGLIGGVVTGLGMAAACGSVEDQTGCGNFVAGWEAAWLLVTVVSALFMDANSWTTLPVQQWSVVAAYARYPQGVPTSMTGEPYAAKAGME